MKYIIDTPGDINPVELYNNSHILCLETLRNAVKVIEMTQDCTYEYLTVETGIDVFYSPEKPGTIKINRLMTI